MPLAMRMRAGEDLDGADRIDAHFRRFPQADARAERTHGRRGRVAGGDQPPVEANHQGQIQVQSPAQIIQRRLGGGPIARR